MRPAAVLSVLRLGQRGEGVAAGPIYLFDALPGERVEADVDGDRGRVLAVLERSPHRIEPICPYYGICGGCAVQSLGPDAYADWKRDLVVTALSMAKVQADVGRLVPAHGAGRRRVTVHARAQAPVNLLAPRAAVVGFMQARAHDIVAIAACPILAPDLGGALPAARALAEALAPTGKPLDILVTATRNGLDIDLRGSGPLDETLTQTAIKAAIAQDCARLSNHGSVLIERRPPVLRMGTADLLLPPGSFLQATERGEEVLAGEVLTAARGARRVLDLFAGVGTFALRLAPDSTVHAADNEAGALAALARAARAQPSLRPVTTDVRDLFRRPFTAAELTPYDAVVFDPPRAGAQAQAEQLAISGVPTVIAVSCNPASFARDAAILLRGGYRIDRVTPVDQFLYAAHVEIGGVFRRPPARTRRRGVLS